MSELVRDWMTSTVVAIESTTELISAEELMADHEIRRLVVVDEGELVGVISESDVRDAKSSSDGTRFNGLKVADVMADDPVTVPESATIALAAQTMLQLKVSGLPVVNDYGDLCGVLSEADLFRFIVERVD